MMMLSTTALVESGSPTLFTSTRLCSAPVQVSFHTFRVSLFHFSHLNPHLILPAQLYCPSTAIQDLPTSFDLINNICLAENSHWLLISMYSPSVSILPGTINPSQYLFIPSLKLTLFLSCQHPCLTSVYITVSLKMV